MVTSAAFACIIRLKESRRCAKEPAMFTSFRVQNFRGLSDLTIEPLDRVNLITGKNNTGKTALLEAIYLHCKPEDPQAAIDVNRFRNVTVEPGSARSLQELCNWLFPQKSNTRPIFFSSLDGDQIERHLSFFLLYPKEYDPKLAPTTELVADIAPQFMEHYASADFAILLRYGQTGDVSVTESVGFPISSQGSFLRVKSLSSWHPAVRYVTFGGTILDEESDLFSEIDASNRQDQIVNPLRILEPRIQRFSLLIFNGKPVIHVGINNSRLMPITFMGEGFRRLLAIVLAIVNTQGGILLIDEIDAGLHHSILPKVFEAIGQAARASDVQVFATTHSYECIMAAHRAFDEHEPYDLRLHRLERIDDRVQAITYDRETLETSEELMLEVR
jgi:predicted ATPase